MNWARRSQCCSFFKYIIKRFTLQKEISSAYRKEWELFRLPGGISTFLILVIDISQAFIIIGQPMLRKDAGYETGGFDLIMWFHFTPNALVVKKDSPFQTLADFLKYAGENPKAATVGGSGSFSANHLETLRLAKAADVQITYVPHTGTGPVVPALLGGHITSAMGYSMLGVQYKDQVRVLAVAADERIETLPEAPTFKELGYDIVGGAFRGVAAPKGTDPQIVAKLAKAFSETNKIIAEKQRALGFVMTYATAEDAYALVGRMKNNYEGILQEIAAQKNKN